MFEFIKNLFAKKAPKLPKTFEEAVDYVAERIGNNTVNDPVFHFTGGMQMRNELDLWNHEGVLHKHMLERFGLCHADDTGMLISKAAHAKKNNQQYDPEVDVEICKRHWAAFGLDAATLKSSIDNVGQ